MKMPQDFVDAINEAVKAVNPDAGTMVSGSFTLGSDFDEWLGPQAMLKYGLDPMPQEEIDRFNVLFEQKRQVLKDQIVASTVEVAKKRLAGTLEPFSFNDSHRKPAAANAAA